MEKREAEKDEYWERFMQTGSVADYLNYKADSIEENTTARGDGLSMLTIQIRGNNGRVN